MIDLHQSPEDIWELVQGYLLEHEIRIPVDFEFPSLEYEPWQSKRTIVDMTVSQLIRDHCSDLTTQILREMFLD